jgi:hypothetical protein
MTQVAVILPQSISAIGTFTKLDNSYLAAGLADYLAIDPGACSGFGDAPLRTTVDDAPGDDGALIEEPKDGGLIVTIAGDLFVTSTGASNEAGYFDAVESLYQELKAALDALKTAPADLVHHAGSMKVRKQSELDPTFTSFWTMRVTFSLIQDVFA